MRDPGKWREGEELAWLQARQEWVKEREQQQLQQRQPARWIAEGGIERKECVSYFVKRRVWLQGRVCRVFCDDFFGSKLSVLQYKNSHLYVMDGLAYTIDVE